MSINSKKIELKEYILHTAMIVSIMSYLYLAKGNITRFILFDADKLITPSVMRDVIRNPLEIANWQLPPAPGYFPEWIIHFFSSFFFRDEFYAVLSFAILQVLAVYFLVRLIFEILGIANSGWYSLFFVFIMLLASISNPIAYSLVWASSMHFNTFTSLLLILLLNLIHVKTGKSGKIHTSVTIIVVFLSCLSDALVFSQTILPIFILFFMILRKLVNNQARFWKLLVINTIPGVLGVVLYPYLVFIEKRPNITFSFDAVIAKMENPFFFFKSLYFNDMNLMKINLIALLSILVFLFWKFRYRKMPKLTVFFLLFIPLNFLASILSVLIVPTLSPSPIYFISATFLPLIGLLLICTYLLDKRIIHIAILSLGTISVYFLLSSTSFDFRKSDVVRDVACVQKTIGKDSRFGISNYWDGKMVEALTLQHLEIAQYQGDPAEPFSFITNFSYFENPVDFALVWSGLTPKSLFDLSEKAVIQRFGSPLEKNTCGRWLVLLYR